MTLILQPNKNTNMQNTNYSESMVSLEDALSNQNTSGKPIKTFVGFNTGHRTFTIVLSLYELNELSQVANEQSLNSPVAQRKLDIPHATAIGKYVLKGLLSSVELKNRKQGKPISKAFEYIQNNIGTQPYQSIPPIVASFRNCDPNGTNLSVQPMKVIGEETACFKIFLNHGDILWIVDGQHRKKGIEQVFEFLNYIQTYHKYPSRSSLFLDKSKPELSPDELEVWHQCLEQSKACTIAVEVHLGLNIDQERQLFHDLNNLAKKVEKSLAFRFDGSNPINQYIREVLIEDLFEQEPFNIFEKDKVNWQEEEVGITRKDLVAISAILFLNKTNINGATPNLIETKKELANAFWQHVLKIEGITTSQSRLITVAAQPVVLKALAKLVFDFNFGKNKEWLGEENSTKLFNGMLEVDFSHKNPMWRYYEFSKEERELHGLSTLSEYLPDEDEGFNRDMGFFDKSTNVFRFGAKHNDIYPLIGDMIRWKLALPKRKREEKQIELV